MARHAEDRLAACRDLSPGEAAQCAGRQALPEWKLQRPARPPGDDFLKPSLPGRSWKWAAQKLSDLARLSAPELARTGGEAVYAAQRGHVQEALRRGAWRTKNFRPEVAADWKRTLLEAADWEGSCETPPPPG